MEDQWLIHRASKAGGPEYTPARCVKSGWENVYSDSPRTPQEKPFTEPL